MKQNIEQVKVSDVPGCTTGEDRIVFERPSSDTTPSDCSVLTRCEICKQDCDTMAGLIVHVHKFHPAWR